jgi:Flp pilus assembly pilin Flp
MEFRFSKWLVRKVGSFFKDEAGLAMTEYLVILGVLTAGVVTVITMISSSLETAHENWSSQYSNQVVVLVGPEDSGGGGTGSSGDGGSGGSGGGGDGGDTGSSPGNSGGNGGGSDKDKTDKGKKK